MVFYKHILYKRTPGLGSIDMMSKKDDEFEDMVATYS